MAAYLDDFFFFKGFNVFLLLSVNEAVVASLPRFHVTSVG